MENAYLLEELSKFLPSHLGKTAKEALAQTILGGFPDTSDATKVFSRLEETSLFQGDCLREVPFPSLNSGTGTADVTYIDSILVSNTCDVDSLNQRLIPSLATFAATVSIAEYERTLREAKVDEGRIMHHLADVKANRVSNIMYLPALTYTSHDDTQGKIIRFDWLYSMSNDAVHQNFSKSYLPDGDRLFSLSDYGFYVLLYKLSVHFCRRGENVDRG